MLPTRMTVGSSSAVRKSRMEGRPSQLPRPRRPGSIDRPSGEAWRASGVRSSSAEPPSGHHAPSTHSTAAKLPLYRRSRSQQSEGERRLGPATTPLRATLHRPITTPRTPSEDRMSRNWQTSLDRALASVTVKDARPIQNVAWQRTQAARVQEALVGLAGGPDGAGATLVRPLTIARFVEMTNALLSVLTKDPRLNTDNYIARLPHVSKRLLYPGVVSKSWLRTVNTLHTFPQALALLAYLVDLVARVEAPIDDDWLYVEKHELAQLRRSYFYKCWIRFQDPDHQFQDLDEEYLEQVKLTLGDDDERIAELRSCIEQYRALLEDELESAARAEEVRCASVRAALLAALRAERTERVATRTCADEKRTRNGAAHDFLRTADTEIEHATAEVHQLRRELEAQPLSVAERTRLLEEVDYANRVIDSKRLLADQVVKMVFAKENELALWQKKTLDVCVEYTQGIIHLSTNPRHADLAALAVDEKELMGAGCVREMSAALDALKRKHAALGDELADLERERRHCVRRRATRLVEIRTALTEACAALERERVTGEAQRVREAAAAAEWKQERHHLTESTDLLCASRTNHERTFEQLSCWKLQEQKWMSNLAMLRRGVEKCRAEAEAALPAAKEWRARLVLGTVSKWHKCLDRLTQPDGAPSTSK